MYEQCAVWVVADAPAATLTTQAPGRVLLHYIFYPGKRWLLLGNGRIIVLCVGLRVHYAVYWWVCGWVCNWFLCYQSSFVCSPCSYSCSGLSLMQSDVMFAPSSDVKQENCSRTERWPEMTPGLLQRRKEKALDDVFKTKNGKTRIATRQANILTILTF